MKKLLLFAAAATMFAACSKDTTEDIAVLPDGTLRVSFSEDDSRVQLDENSRTVWNEGDLISVFNKTNGNECWRFDGKTGDSVGTISRVSGSAGGSAIGKIFAVYPYAEYNAVSADGTITTEIPATQKYCADSYGVGNNIMVASSESSDLAFKNVLGWIKIRLSGTETVKSLVLEGNDGETLAGAAVVDADLAVSLTTDAAKSLTLDCGEGVALSSDPTAFYFAVVPQVFEKGITVTAHYSNGSTFKKSTDKAITVERNHIVPMTKFDATVIPNNQIWYTSTDGKIVVPYATDGFGANIISNTYENGKGIITFDGEIKAIGNSAFSGCSSLTSVTIPDSVTTFLNYAFYRCNNLTAFYGYCASADNRYLVQNGKLIAFAPYGLTKYVIPDNVTSIGNSAFSGCSSLSSVNIPDSVTTIEVGAFYDCSSLTSVTIPDSVTTIGVAAFYYCSSLTSITIPDSVTSIGNHTFGYCKSLTSINIPDSVTSIGSYAFSSCSSLTSVTIPNSVTSIESSAFTPCISLKAVYITDIAKWCAIIFNGYDSNPLYYAHNLYLNGELVTDLIIPNSVTTIGNHAFRNCSSLTSINIPDSVTSIGSYAFSSCSSLTSVTIPNSVTSIGSYAFAPCLSLKAVYITDIAKWCAIKFNGYDSNPLYYAHNLYLNGELITDLIIPDSVTTIGDSAFRSCSSLTSINIPDSVTSIGSYAFSSCSSLTSIYCKPTTPPALEANVFQHVSTSAKIYVPKASADTYKSTRYWSNYASIIEGYDF